MACCFYDLSAAPRFDPDKHGALQARTARALAQLGLIVEHASMWSNLRINTAPRKAGCACFARAGYAGPLCCNRSVS